MKLSWAVKPISCLKQHTADALKEVNENSNALVITQNGEAKAVLMDIVGYANYVLHKSIFVGCVVPTN